ncbi:MAG TPA: DUF4331 domain-containing protein [Vicinamibacterales bacterium]|nr:DUF4331 domain-containing protein [Vicinamibacterales bacterium]
MSALSKRIGLALAVAALAGMGVHASSHREAPGITKSPKVDGTDFYMFRSYEPGRQNYVTVIANYVPLQDVYGGPNFFQLDEDALYDIHLDNDGDAIEDLTFEFRFTNTARNLSLNIGGQAVAIPLINAGGIGPDPADTAALNVTESYTLTLVRGDRERGKRSMVVNAQTGGRSFAKPVDRIGDKSIRDDTRGLGSVPPNDRYNEYANNHIYEIAIPDCHTSGRVFVGQRREGFVVNLAETFDLINLNPVGSPNEERNDLASKNVTSLALELPIDCVTSGHDPVIGGWTTASVKRSGDKGKEDPRRDFVQVSRLGHPLVNEVVIGYKDKNKFNGSEPKHDGQFAKYVTNPTLPALIEALFSVPAPTVPRNDLVQVFLTGVPGLTQPQHVTPSEMLRLNTSIAPVAPASQNPLGVLGSDPAGFPNGRRPGDDVVDIELRAVMGVLLPADQAPAGQLPYTDGAFINAMVGYAPSGALSADPGLQLFRPSFPYLQVPLSGSPNPAHGLAP